MAQMDIIDATRRAYRTIWDERSYLLRLAMIPLGLKLICFTLAANYADSGTYMRSVLIMLPAILAEGWMLAHFIRLLGLNHRWPFRPTGDMNADFSVLHTRARGILSGTIVFALINMALGFLVATVGPYFSSFLPENPSDAAHVDIPGYALLMSVGMLAFMFWGFRLTWLYIPYALNMTPGPYLFVLRGLGTSVHLIGLWLLCFLPFYLVLGVFTGVIGPALAALLGKSVATLLALVMGVIADTLKTLLTTAGVTYALMQVFKANKMDAR